MEKNLRSISTDNFNKGDLILFSTTNEQNIMEK
jgi:hypothetical protein